MSPPLLYFSGSSSLLKLQYISILLENKQSIWVNNFNLSLCGKSFTWDIPGFHLVFHSCSKHPSDLSSSIISSWGLPVHRRKKKILLCTVLKHALLYFITFPLFCSQKPSISSYLTFRFSSVVMMSPSLDSSAHLTNALLLSRQKSSIKVLTLFRNQYWENVTINLPLI